jgi:hypothetical protein
MACCDNTIASVPYELKMTLYQKEVYVGPDVNGYAVVEGKKIGQIDVYSWQVTDGPRPDANIIGHMRGTSVYVAHNPSVYHYSLGLVFEGKRWDFLSLAKYINSLKQIDILAFAICSLGSKLQVVT